MSKTKEFFRGLRKGQEQFGQTIAGLINAILLTFVYVVGVGLTAIVAKVSKKKFLETKLTKDKTYWSNVQQDKEKQSYYRQF